MKMPKGGQQSAAVTKPSHKIVFDALLDAGKQWIEWIDESKKFEGSVAGKIQWDGLDSTEREFVSRRLKTALPGNQVLLNSLYVTMVAGFEEFLRASIRSIAISFNDQNLSFDKLSAKLIRMNIRETAKLLKRLDSPPDYIPFNENDLCRVIGTCVSNSKKVEIDQHAISDIEGLLKLESFFKRIDDFGKTLGWDVLGANVTVKVALGAEKMKPREAGKALSSALEDIARYRNRIAHTGGAASDVTIELISDHRRLLRATSEAIVGALS